MNFSDPKSRSKVTTGVAIATAGLLLFIAPWLFTALTSLLGAGVAAVAIAAGYVAVIQLIPWWSLKMTNLGLKLLKLEARRNPVETAQNELRKMAQDLDDFKKDTANFLIRGNTLIDDAAELAKTDPEGAADYDDMIKNFRREADMREAKLASAVIELEEAGRTVDKIRRRWEMQTKHSGFTTNSKEADRLMSKIVIDEALGEVMKRAHTATASMVIDNVAREALSQHKKDRNANHRLKLEAQARGEVVPTTIENKVEVK